MFEFPENAKPILGTEEATLDDKGRLLVSKKKRERLGNDFTLAFGSIGCLTAFPSWAWSKYVDSVMSGDMLNFGREEFARLVLGTADDELKFDAQGRVVVPYRLRDMAKLNKEVLLIGCGDRMEIWSADEYAKYMAGPEEYGFARKDLLMKAYINMTGRLQ